MSSIVDDILAASPQRRERVEVAGVPGGLYANELTAAQRISLQSAITASGGDRTATVVRLCVAACVTDANGARAFEPEDVDRLPYRVADALWDAVDRVNAFTAAAAKAATEAAGF